MIGLAVVVAVVSAMSWARLRWRVAARLNPSPPVTHRPHTPTEQEWAALLDAIAADLRGGSSLRSAVAAGAGSAGLTGVAFNPTTTLSVVSSLTSPEPSEAVVLQTVTVAAALGGAAATTLESGAALLRERAAIRADVVAHAAQAQLSARVLTAVPLIFAAWSLAASRSFRAAVCSPPGAVCVALGLLCNAAGWWWMRRIVASAWQ